jgi:hypothetical protein
VAFVSVLTALPVIEYFPPRRPISGLPAFIFSLLALLHCFLDSISIRLTEHAVI